MELAKKYRPKDFSDVVGQDHIVKPLSKMVEKNKIPHAILFEGPPGCGKTSFGRIISSKLKCSKWDFTEQNCANKRGIESIRDIEKNMNMSPMKGKVKVWLLDESHMLTGEAQDAALKVLEEPPSHVYFILCTTDPKKLKTTIRSRCTEYPIKPLDAATLTTLVKKIAKAENVKLSDEVVEKIVSNADNSARNALVMLDKIILLEDEEDQLEAISKASVETAAIQIARTLFDNRTKWPDMAKVLRETELEEPESMRYMILGYARSILLKGSGGMAEKAFRVIEVFRDNFYDSKSAGLVSACYEVITGK